MFNYDRLLQTALREFEAGITGMVEREFEALRALPDDKVKIPFIGEMPYTHELFNPHAPLEELAAVKALVAQALRAQKWFEFEGPRWAQPLPLSFEECKRLNGLRPGEVSYNWCRRGGLMGRYAHDLREFRWKYERMLPFEQYCAQWLRC